VRAAIDRFAAKLAGAGAKVTGESPLLRTRRRRPAVRAHAAVGVRRGGSRRKLRTRSRRGPRVDVEDRSLGASEASVRYSAIATGSWPTHSARCCVSAGATVRQFDVVLCPVMPTRRSPMTQRSGWPTDHIDGDRSTSSTTGPGWRGALPGLPATVLPIAPPRTSADRGCGHRADVRRSHHDPVRRARRAELWRVHTPAPGVTTSFADRTVEIQARRVVPQSAQATRWMHSVLRAPTQCAESTDSRDFEIGDSLRPDAFESPAERPHHPLSVRRHKFVEFVAVLAQPVRRSPPIGRTDSSNRQNDRE